MLREGNKKQTAGLYTATSIPSTSHHSWLNLPCLVELVRLRRSAGLCAVGLNLAAHLEKQCNFIPCVCFLFIRQSFCTTTAFFLASVSPSWRIIKPIFLSAPSPQEIITKDLAAERLRTQLLLSARSRTRVKQPEELSRPDCHEIRRAWHTQSRCLALERNPAKSMLGPSCATRTPNRCRDPQARSQTSHILPLCFGSHNTVQEFFMDTHSKISPRLHQRVSALGYSLCPYHTTLAAWDPHIGLLFASHLRTNIWLPDR